MSASQHNLDPQSDNKTIDDWWCNNAFINSSNIRSTTIYINNDYAYSPYILFTENTEYLFFHINVHLVKKETIVSKILEILGPLDVYDEILPIEDIVLTQDQIEFYKNSQNFFNRETPLYVKSVEEMFRKSIEENLEEKRLKIKEKYTNLIKNIIGTYDAMRDHFLPGSKNRYANSVNYTSYKDGDEYMLYNTPQKLCMIITDTTVSRNVWNYIPDFIVIETKCISPFRSYFHMKTFNSISELKNYAEKFESIMQIKNPNDVIQENTSEKEKVISYIKTNYDIHDNMEPEFRKSSDDILNELKNELLIDKKEIYQFHIRLSKYLRELGIKKNRFTNGYYYYGMERKYSKYISRDLTNINLQELEETRDKELQEILKDSKKTESEVTIQIGNMNMESYKNAKKEQNRSCEDIMPMEYISGMNELDSNLCPVPPIKKEIYVPPRTI